MTTRSRPQLSVRDRSSYAQRFFTRLKLSRRSYLFEKLQREEKKDFGFSEIWLWIKMDLKYLLLSLQSSYTAWNQTKDVIRDEYGLSGIKQLVRMLYIVLVQKNKLKHFYKILLFKDENWKRADQFTYRIAVLQDQLAVGTFPVEKRLIDDKLQFFEYCKRQGLRTPNVFAFGDADQFEFIDKEQIANMKCDLFVKHRIGGEGLDCIILRYDENNYFLTNGNSFQKEQLIEGLKSLYSGRGAYVVQPRLQNHDSWEKWTPGSLATCRIVSARNPANEKQIIPLFGAFRMPVEGLDTDNHSQGGLAAPISMQDGELGRAFTLKNLNGKYEFDKHPQTNARITGAKIPYWNKILDYTVQVHSQFKSCFVGWDLTLTNEGCIVIEGNITWAAGSYEIPWQDSLMNTDYPWLHERWCEKVGI